MLAFLRESAHTFHFLSVSEYEIQADLCEWITEGGYCVCVRNVFCLSKCAYLWRDKKHSKSLVDAGFICDKARGAYNFPKILVARMVTWCKFHTEDPQISGTTVQSLVAVAVWGTGFMHRGMFLWQLPWLGYGNSLFVEEWERSNSHTSHTCGLISCHKMLTEWIFHIAKLAYKFLACFLYCAYKIKWVWKLKEANWVGVSDLH